MALAAVTVHSNIHSSDPKTKLTSLVRQVASQRSLNVSTSFRNVYALAVLLH